jgi:hypothetical protein
MGIDLKLKQLDFFYTFAEEEMKVYVHSRQGVLRVDTRLTSVMD